MNANLSLRFQPTVDLDPDQPTRFEGLAYSGGVIPNYGLYGDAAIDLESMVVSAKPVFALVNHDSNQRAGKVELRKIESGLLASGSFSLSTDAGRQVAAEFAEGAPWELSVGINAEVEVFPKRTDVELNGRTLSVDSVFRKARVRELSFVPAGADPDTHVVAFERSFPVSLPPDVEKFMSEDREKLIALEAANVELNSKLSATEALVADLSAQLAAVKQQLSVEAEKARQVEAQLQAQREVARKQAVELLFADLGQELTAERAQPYLAMSDDSFAIISADLRALAAPVVDPKLFVETATSGKSQDSNVAELGAQLFKQVAGVK